MLAYTCILVMENGNIARRYFQTERCSRNTGTDVGRAIVHIHRAICGWVVFKNYTTQWWRTSHHDMFVMLIFVPVLDINECLESTDSCDDNAFCVNTLGGYNCTNCKPGYLDVSGDGKICQGKLIPLQRHSNQLQSLLLNGRQCWRKQKQNKPTMKIIPRAILEYLCHHIMISPYKQSK